MENLKGESGEFGQTARHDGGAHNEGRRAAFTSCDWQFVARHQPSIFMRATPNSTVARAKACITTMPPQPSTTPKLAMLRATPSVYDTRSPIAAELQPSARPYAAPSSASKSLVVAASSNARV
jgi:hypothetical protein